MGQDRETNIALLIDFDNVALGARDARQRFDIKFLMQRLLEKGKILVKIVSKDYKKYFPAIAITVVNKPSIKLMPTRLRISPNASPASFQLSVAINFLRRR